MRLLTFLALTLSLPVFASTKVTCNISEQSERTSETRVVNAEIGLAGITEVGQTNGMPIYVVVDKIEKGYAQIKGVCLKSNDGTFCGKNEIGVGDRGSVSALIHCAIPGVVPPHPIPKCYPRGTWVYDCNSCCSKRCSWIIGEPRSRCD